MALVLARQATALLQRTRLGVKISCQALHSKNARHMLLDVSSSMMFRRSRLFPSSRNSLSIFASLSAFSTSQMIDFFAPTLVIVGSRGLSALKGILLGSTSHYLVQKSSVPVMVARKRLKLPALPRVRRDVVESVRARHMRLDEAAIEKESKVEEKVDEEGKTKADNEGEQSEEKSETEGKATSTSNPEDQTGVSEQEKKEEPKRPEQIAERASEETDPISPPLEDSNVKSSDAAAPLNHSIFPSLQTQGEDGTQTQLQPSQSNDSTTESVTHLAQDQESPQRGRSMKQTKE